MNWVRRVFVYLLSIILLVSLLGMALAISAQASLTHPNKVENWLNQSNLYASLATTITNQAQNAIQNNVTGGAAISKTVIQQAAQTSLPESLLKQDVQTFINSNYAWLEGKTAMPNFKIDLSGAKQEFANKVADASVLTHLTGLSICTPSQTLQLEGANPLLLSCIPAGVSPQFEATQVSQQLVDTSAFLGNPVITANTVSTKGLGGHAPYYKKLSTLPKWYQLSQKLPWILGISTLLSSLGIIFCARSKRAGWRRIGIVLLISGILLVVDKFATDAVFNKYKGRIFDGVSSGQIQQSLTDLAHYIETELVKINLLMGVVYIILALILLSILILTRHRTPRSAKEAKVTPKANNTSAVNHRPKGQPSFDMLSPRSSATDSPQVPRVTRQAPKKRPPSRPPRLIQ